MDRITIVLTRLSHLLVPGRSQTSAAMIDTIAMVEPQTELLPRVNLYANLLQNRLRVPKSIVYGTCACALSSLIDRLSVINFIPFFVLVS